MDILNAINAQRNNHNRISGRHPEKIAMNFDCFKELIDIYRLGTTSVIYIDRSEENSSKVFGMKILRTPDLKYGEF